MKFILHSSIIFTLVCIFIALNIQAMNSRQVIPATQEPQSKWTENSLFRDHIKYRTDGFDFPVGPPNASGYYNAQKFTENNHLGEDWNALSGGDSDLGHPIFSIANGWVSKSYNAGPGWGNIIRIIHENQDGEKVESLYAHCDKRLVSTGDWVKRGDTIATIGNANGAYLAHLHLELRSDCDLELGPGYSDNTQGYISPTEFIKSHRPNR